MFRSTNFDKYLEKATSQLLLEPDWGAILQVCDSIRQGDVSPKNALTSITKKINDPNPNVGLYALQVLESCVKNCGTRFHEEIASKQFMENLHDLVKQTGNEKIRHKILELVQIWAHAFRNETKFRAVQDIVTIMKAEGYQFPALKESDAMFSADTAPEWAEGDCCYICRRLFSILKRKHHCRACGQVFCDACSSHSVTLPKFGIEKEVRVCDNCLEQVTKPNQASGNKGDSDSSNLSSQHSSPVKKSTKEIEASEEEDLQLAIALSKSEAEEKEKEKLRQTHTLLYNFGNSESQNTKPEVKPEPKQEPTKTSKSENMDPDLARYLNRSYWEQKKTTDGNKNEETPRPSAPIHNSEPESVMKTNEIKLQNHNGETDNLDDFISTLHSQIEMFVNRMKSNSDRGRSIAYDSSVQNLFLNVTAMHSNLLKYIQEQDDMRVYYEALQDKLTQIRDARGALDALRDEHRDKLRREAEEAQRLRQIQMAQKLELMRQKKQEYLEYQRQLALKQMLEKEREMQFRLEHQKQQYIHMGGIVPGNPTGYPAGPPGIPPPQPPSVPSGPYIPPTGYTDHPSYPQVNQAYGAAGTAGPYQQVMPIQYGGTTFEHGINAPVSAPVTVNPGGLPGPSPSVVPPAHNVHTSLPPQVAVAAVNMPPIPHSAGPMSISAPQQPIPPSNMHHQPPDQASHIAVQQTAELISFD